MGDRAFSIDQNFEERSRKARLLLTDLCIQGRVVEGMNGARRWAIVGGVVRDLLVRKDINSCPLPGIAWPDIDIAVTEGTLEINHKILKVQEFQSNTYGGLKLTTQLFGIVDMWAWPQSSPEENWRAAWERQLEAVEFGLNGVAFVWPEKEIVVHPQWRRDLRARRVETLTDKVLNRELHVVRGCALATKLSAELGSHVGFGPELQRDIDWLLESASPEAVGTALTYLSNKVSEGRWSSRILVRLADCVRRLSAEGRPLSNHFLAGAGSLGISP